VWPMQERFVLLEGVPAGALGAAQGCLQPVGDWRPAPSVRGTAQRGGGHCPAGLVPDPLCHRLLPLPRETFSEIGRHAGFITVRLYRFDTIDTIGSRRKNGDFGDSSAREWPWYMRSLSPSFARDCHGTLTLVDRSTPRLPGL
jgi:hypothetical protein